jgi:hypothetical protein
VNFAACQIARLPATTRAQKSGMDQCDTAQSSGAYVRFDATSSSRRGASYDCFPSVDAPVRARENVGVVVARGRMLSSVRPLMRQDDSRRPVWEFAVHACDALAKEHMPGSIRSMHLEHLFRDVQTDRANLLHGRLLWWQFDTATLARRWTLLHGSAGWTQ